MEKAEEFSIGGRHDEAVDTSVGSRARVASRSARARRGRSRLSLPRRDARTPPLVVRYKGGPTRCPGRSRRRSCSHLERCWGCSGDAELLRLAKAALARVADREPTAPRPGFDAGQRTWAERERTGEDHAGSTARTTLALDGRRR